MLKNLINSAIKGLVIGLLLVGGFRLLEGAEVQIDEKNLIDSYGSFTFNNKQYGHTIRIVSDDGSCSAVVIDDHYALTAAHCVVNTFQRLNTDLVFSVFDEQGIFTFISAKPVAANLSRDVALLKGNFSAFSYASVDFAGVDSLDFEDSLLSCGFPSAQELLYCAKWRFKGSYDFREVAAGVTIQKGCSGGPVFNKYGRVIGVNSAVFGERFLIGPIVGVLDDFGIQSK